MEKGKELVSQLNVIIERSVKAKKAGEEDNDVIIFGNRVVTIVGIPLLCVRFLALFLISLHAT